MNPARACAASCGALGAWCALWYGLLHPSTALNPLLGTTLLALPILLCVRPAWRGVRLALGGAGLLAIGYLAHAAMELVANPPERTAAAIAASLALAVLATASHALRAAARAALRPAAPT